MDSSADRIIVLATLAIIAVLVLPLLIATRATVRRRVWPVVAP